MKSNYSRPQNPVPKMSLDSFLKKEDKKIIRNEVLGNRKKLFEENNNVFKKSCKTVIDTLRNTEEYKKANVIMCFVSFKDEIETHYFIKEALKEGKRILVPYIANGEPDMKVSEIKNFKDLKPGFYGILAPDSENLNLVDKREIELVVCPGAAFNNEGYRVGYGGGYYDKFLYSIKDDVSIIGIGFDLQKIDEIPVDTFDIPVHSLITESGRIDFKKEEK